MALYNTVSSQEALVNSKIFLQTKVPSSVSNKVSYSFQYFLLVPIPHMNNIILISIYIHTQNYKAVNTYYFLCYSSTTIW